MLDLYIALKVREDVWMDETELHLERDDCFKDLFDLMQVGFSAYLLSHGKFCLVMAREPRSGQPTWRSASRLTLPFLYIGQI